MRKAKRYVFLAIGWLILYLGISQLQDSQTWLEAFKGLFWMGIAGIGLWTGLSPNTDKE